MPGFPGLFEVFLVKLVCLKCLKWGKFGLMFNICFFLLSSSGTTEVICRVLKYFGGILY